MRELTYRCWHLYIDWWWLPHVGLHEDSIIFTVPLMCGSVKLSHWNTFPTLARHDLDMLWIPPSPITRFQMLTPVISPMKLWEAWKDPPTESWSWPSTSAPPLRTMCPSKDFKEKQWVFYYFTWRFWFYHYLFIPQASLNTWRSLPLGNFKRNPRLIAELNQT